MRVDWDTSHAHLSYDDAEPVDPAITDDGPAFDVHHDDEWVEEGALTDSDNDEGEEEWDFNLILSFVFWYKFHVTFI